MEGCVVLSVDGVTVSYNGQTVLHDVSFSVLGGERLAIVGPNGAGKSSLFRAIVGMLPLRSGRIEVLGCDPTREMTSISYVAQRGNVDLGFPVTVRDVVMMGRIRHIGWLRWPSRRDRLAVARALEQVEMDAWANRQIGELSGGQQQRVFIARALAQEADLLLMDEPFAHVDTASEQAILDLLVQLKSVGLTVLCATHDLNVAADRFERVLLLNKEIVALGAPQEVFCPDVLRRAYGGQLAVWEHERGLVMLGDSHCSLGEE